MTSPYALVRTTEKTSRLPMRGREPTTEADLSRLRSDQVAGDIAKYQPDPGIFADAVTAGLQNPVSGAAAAISPWMHPGTSMSERWTGGRQAYADKLREVEEATSLPSRLAQQLAGGAIMGGPSQSLWKQGAFDAGTGGVQSWAAGNDWGQAGADALTNLTTGGLFNVMGLGRMKLDERDEMVRELLKIAGMGGS